MFHCDLNLDSHLSDEHWPFFVSLLLKVFTIFTLYIFNVHDQNLVFLIIFKINENHKHS